MGDCEGHTRPCNGSGVGRNILREEAIQVKPWPKQKQPVGLMELVMDEATKTNSLRNEEFRKHYFSGSVIDIGCGPDLVVPHATPFDVEHGDAQWVSNHFPAESFDCVHSSHCLEHMINVPVALRNWWMLVKPGGHLVVVVPEEDLYEQGAWPSLFNADHKATFRLFRPTSWSPVSYDIGTLVRELPGAEIVSAVVQDYGYDRHRSRIIGRWGRVAHRIARKRRAITSALVRRGLPLYRIGKAIEQTEELLGAPVDQTLGPAMAQIQIIAKKSPVAVTAANAAQ